MARPQSLLAEARRQRPWMGADSLSKRVKLPSVRRAGTRGFRAPEVLMLSSEQTVALDVWSAGVIMLSIMTRRSPFFNSPDDLTALAELAVVFSPEALDRAAKQLREPRRIMFEGGSWAPVNWRDLCARFGSDEWPPEAYDLLDRCLCLNPERRISAKDALRHPFLAATVERG